jgi:hypothetical protein
MKKNIISFLAVFLALSAEAQMQRERRREYSQDRVLRDFSENPISAAPVQILQENSYLNRPIDFRKNEANSRNSTASKA